jgi:DNA-binding winged helix-turn-helix (wHTH) protein
MRNELTHVWSWPDTVVEESNLSVQIAALRKLLGPTPNGGEWISTVSRVGYRFDGDAVSLLRCCRMTQSGMAARDVCRPAAKIDIGCFQVSTSFGILSQFPIYEL